MGYTSSVGIVLRNEDYPMFKIGAEENCPEALELIKDYATVRSNLEFTVIEFDSVKWAETRDDVGFIESYINLIPHLIIIIGSDIDDTEYRYNTEFMDDALKMMNVMKLVRRIDVEL